MNRCRNCISRCFLQKTQYPENTGEIWSISQDEINRILAAGQIPEIRIKDIPEDGRPKIAVMLNREKHPDRELKDYSMPIGCIKAVVLSGGYPVFLSFEKIGEQLENIKPDGIFLTGGDFALPKEWLEAEPAHAEDICRRDAYVTALNYAKDNRLPLLGICAGMQMLAGFCGAKIKQVTGHRGQLDYAHEMKISQDSLLYAITKTNSVEVNSNHSEAVSTENTGNCKITAWAPDGVAEAIEPCVPWNGFVIGIQSHPEKFVDKGDDFAAGLFKSFIKACQK